MSRPLGSETLNSTLGKFQVAPRSCITSFTVNAPDTSTGKLGMLSSRVKCSLLMSWVRRSGDAHVVHAREC